MIMKRAEKDFLALLHYLNVECRMKLSVVLQHDPEYDLVNTQDPRAFCYVERDDPTVIHCTKNLEYLDKNSRLGVLMHELGHIVLDAFHGDESEVDVDSWCLEFIPEAGYHYRDTKYQKPTRDGILIKHAKSLQHVSPAFIRILEQY